MNTILFLLIAICLTLPVSGQIANFGGTFVTCNLAHPTRGTMRISENADSITLTNFSVLVGPASYFYLYTTNTFGQKCGFDVAGGVRVPDENGDAETPIRHYTNENIVIQLPSDINISEYRGFGIWCENARINFGSVAIPGSPPSNSGSEPFIPSFITLFGIVAACIII